MGRRWSRSISICSSSSHELLEARDYALAIAQTVREPLVVLDNECRVGFANEAFHALIRQTPDQTEGRLLWDAAPGPWTDLTTRRRLIEACQNGSTLIDVEVVRTMPGRGLRTLLLNARSIVRAERPTLLLLAIEDVTDMRQAEALRIDAETLRLLDRRKDEFLGILAHELQEPVGPHALRGGDAAPVGREHRGRDARAAGPGAADRAHGAYRR